MVFSPKTGKNYAEAIWCTHTDYGMLNHHALFPVAPIAPTVALDAVNGSAVVAQMAAVRIACHVSTGREIDGEGSFGILVGGIYRGIKMPIISNTIFGCS